MRESNPSQTEISKKKKKKILRINKMGIIPFGGTKIIIKTNIGIEIK